MCKLYLVVFLSIVVGRSASANDLLDLYRLAVTRDNTLQAAVSQRDATVEGRPLALSELLPHLTIQASGTRAHTGSAATTSQVTQTDNCAPSADGTMEHCSGYTHGYGLVLSQTLWSLESFNRLKEASLQGAAAQATLAGAQQSLILRVAQAYFAILSAQDRVTTNRKEREAFGTLLNQARARQQTGVGPRSDVEQAQSFFDATEQSVIDAESSLDDAQLALTEIVGARSTDIAPMREDIPLTLPDPESVEDWVRSAGQNNPGVRAAQLQVNAAERDIAAQWGRAFPTLVFTGTSSRLAQSQALGGTQSSDNVALSFSWPLFQGGAVAASVRQSRALYSQARALYEATQRDTERQTRASYRGVVSGIQRIGAARRAVESGRVAVEASRRNVEFGTGTEFDLLNSQNNYYSSLRAYYQTRYDYLTALLTLEQQAGSLTEHDLEIIDRLLVVHGSDHD
jgi:outer membrane protein